MATCVLCGDDKASVIPHSNADAYEVTCQICGTYDIEGRAGRAHRYEFGGTELRYRLSALTRTAPLR